VYVLTFWSTLNKDTADARPELDRMVAFNVRRGATIPLSAAKFYAGRKLEVFRLEALWTFLKEGLGRVRSWGYS
jgi:hypothetical protein